MLTPTYSVTYPALPNPGGSEVTGGYFNMYFTNMFSVDCGVGLFVYGFDIFGNKNCGSISASSVSSSTLSLSGSLIGTLNYVAKYTPTGTGINNSQIFDNGTNVGVGTATPSAKLEVNGQVRITGGSPGVGRVLTSDATGLATWTSSALGATATGITGGVENYVSKFGTGGTGLYPSQFFDNGTNIGIGTVVPGAKLDIAGTIRIAGGGFASGRVLTSDATGLASWRSSVSMADYALSGAFWRQTGNSGTTSATDYVGTADNQDVVFRRNSIEGMRLSGANSGLSTTADATINGVTVGRGAGNIATNTANGYQALYSNITGYQNSAVGMSSLYSNNTGYNNTALGYLAGSNLTSGNNNIFIGYNTQPNIGNNASNQLNIGNWIYGNNGNIGIGVMNPSTSLDVAGQVRIAGGSPGLGRILTSDATGLASWVSGFSGATTASGITGGSGSYIPYFGSGGVGLYPSFLSYTGSRLAIGTTTPQYMVDIRGSGSIINTGSGYCINSVCLTNWADLNTLVRSSGTPGYISKFDSGGLIGNSQLYETGGKLYIGDIPGILAGAATLGYITVESLGTSNSSNPLLTLSENGGQECRMWLNGSNKLGSNCTWTAGTSGFGFAPNQIPRADATTGDTLTGSVMYNIGNAVGIGTATPDRSLVVAGNSSSSVVPQMQITRGVQGSDTNLGVAYGTPYINIGGLENRVTALQTIGFGYSALAGAVRYAPAEIGFLTTSIAGNTQGDIVFANRNGTTNVAPTEVVRITSVGSVGIGTPTPAAKLDVAGTFKLGTAGVATTAAGVCTIASTAITTTASNYTCTGVPASTAVAISCSAGAALTTPGTTALYCRANGVANSVACNTTVANSVATTYKCMWMQ